MLHLEIKKLIEVDAEVRGLIQDRLQHALEPMGASDESTKCEQNLTAALQALREPRFSRPTSGNNKDETLKPQIAGDGATVETTDLTQESWKTLNAVILGVGELERGAF